MTEPDASPIGEGTTTLDMWRNRAELAERQLQALMRQQLEERDMWQAKLAEAKQEIELKQAALAGVQTERDFLAARWSDSSPTLREAAVYALEHLPGGNPAAMGLRRALALGVPVVIEQDAKKTHKELLVTDGHGNPDPNGKYWTLEASSAAAEREHCERAVERWVDEGSGESSDADLIPPLVELLLHERADATERERARCLAVEPGEAFLQNTSAATKIAEWRQRITSGEKR